MKRKLFIILALVLCMALMVGVLAACNEGGTTGTGGDDTQGDVTPGGDDENQGGNTPGGDDEQGGNTPGGDDENQGGNTPGGNTPGGNPGGDFPWNPGGDDDDDQGGDFPWNPGGDDDDDTPGGDFPWNPGGDGDVIFTEDASLAEIIAALRNVDNYTLEATMNGSDLRYHTIWRLDKTSVYATTTAEIGGMSVEESEATFTQDGVLFEINVDGTGVNSNEKNLLSNTDDRIDWFTEYLSLSYFLAEEKGEVVLNPESEFMEGYDTYLRLEGDKLVIGWAELFDNEKVTYEYVWSKVNATGVIVPDELRELAYGAEWSDSVSYNGVNYRKSADGTYYYVSHNYNGVEPESYINTLPVRENGGNTPGGNTPGGGPPPVEDDDEVDPELAAAWDAMLDDLDAVRADESEVKEFAFALEIAEKGEGEAADERIFSLVFDSVNEYIYGLAGKDGEFLKLNGFDLGHVMMTVLDDWLGLYGESIMGLVPVTADGFKSDQMVGGILLGFVLDYVRNDDAYMFEIDLGAIIDFVIGDGTEENPGLIDIDAGLANAADEETLTTVKNILASIIPEVNADMEFSEIFHAVGDNYTTRVYFGFADAAETAEGADLFGGLVEGFAEASEEEAVNVLNFKGKINIEGKNAAGNSNAAYVADIVLDVDPFALMPMLDLVKGNKPMLDGMAIAEGFKLGFVDFEIGDIIAMLENFGYIHISVDEVKSVSDPTPVKNLFTLHYDSAEGKAVISAATNEVGGEQLAIGGVYDVQALAKVVDKLIKDADAATGAAEAPPVHDHGEADYNGNYACDKNGNMVCDETGEIINIEGLIKKIVGVLAESLGIDMADVEGYFDSIRTNGIVIGFEPILDYTETLLADLTDLKSATVDSLRGTVEELIASDSLTFKVPAKAFSCGTVTKADYVGYEDLLYNLREDETFTNGDAYVSEITGIANADGTQVEAGDIVNVTGKGFDGKTVETTGVVMYVIDGVYYVGIHTDLYANLEVLKDIVAEVDENAAEAIVIPAEWPFYGVLAYAPQV